MARPLFQIVPAEGPGPEVALRVGGVPPLAPAEWPRCTTCGESMAYRFALVHQAGSLDLSPFQVVRVFQCENESFKCRPELPDSGANAVLGAANAQDEKGTRAYGGLLPARENAALLTIDLDEATSEQLAEYERAQQAAPSSKVGGVPVWLQGPQPTSGSDAPMELIAQVSGETWELPFGDGGSGYVFRSPTEPTRYSFLVQSY